MTSPVTSDEHSIEDILAVIRLQAAARARQEPTAASDATSELSRLQSDLPKILTGNERVATASVYPFPRPTSSRLADVLRRAETTTEVDAGEPEAVAAASEVNPPTGSADHVAREMVSFLDTRMSRMSAQQQPVATQQIIENSGPLAQPPVEAAAAGPQIATPATPEAASMELPATILQDGAAELLRPLLKQWLTENMPRIVEKALHMEVAGMASRETETASLTGSPSGNGNSVV